MGYRRQAWVVILLAECHRMVSCRQAGLRRRDFRSPEVRRWEDLVDHLRRRVRQDSHRVDAGKRARRIKHLRSTLQVVVFRGRLKPMLTIMTICPTQLVIRLFCARETGFASHMIRDTSYG